MPSNLGPVYNHALSIAFTVENNDAKGYCTDDEILHGLMRRITLLLENPVEIQEAADVYDTYEVEDPDHVPFTVTGLIGKAVGSKARKVSH